MANGHSCTTLCHDRDNIALGGLTASVFQRAGASRWKLRSVSSSSVKHYSFKFCLQK
ncbi:hypothetical protein J6590_061991 [Homalodisca vitripennis]|nr:hypothetical protein J6590_061991 [Homalodisca vitripennis]